MSRTTLIVLLVVLVALACTCMIVCMLTFIFGPQIVDALDLK
jgi:hypothetical protein